MSRKKGGPRTIGDAWQDNGQWNEIFHKRTTPGRCYGSFYRIGYEVDSERDYPAWRAWLLCRCRSGRLFFIFDIIDVDIEHCRAGEIIGEIRF